MNQRLVERFENVANRVLPQHMTNGITDEDDFILYWITDRYTHDTKVILYDKDKDIFQYQGMQIKC